MKRSSRTRKPPQRLRDSDGDAGAPASSAGGSAGGSAGSAGTPMMHRLASDTSSGGPSAAASLPHPAPQADVDPAVAPETSADAAAPPPGPHGPSAAPKRNRADSADEADPLPVRVPTGPRKRVRRAAPTAHPDAAAAPAPASPAPPSCEPGAVWLPGVPLPFVQREYRFISVLAGDGRTAAQAEEEGDACLRTLCMQPDGLRSVAVPPLTAFAISATGATVVREHWAAAPQGAPGRRWGSPDVGGAHTTDVSAKQ